MNLAETVQCGPMLMAGDSPTRDLEITKRQPPKAASVDWARPLGVEVPRPKADPVLRRQVREWGIWYSTSHELRRSDWMEDRLSWTTGTWVRRSGPTIPSCI